MVYFREPAGAVLAALRLVAQLPEAGLPPAHVGVAAGPVVAQGGDYFGRTVNLAARIAARAGAGQVLVSQRVAESALAEGVRFVALGSCGWRGLPVRCGCWRPTGRRRLLPRRGPGQAAGRQTSHARARTYKQE
jgi:class 3 adenylate cyclase